MTAREVALMVLGAGAGELAAVSVQVLAVIAVVALVASPLLILHWHLGRHKTSVPLMPLPPEETGEDLAEPDCPWCFDRTFNRPEECTCDTECGKAYCMRAVVLAVSEVLSTMPGEDGNG